MISREILIWNVVLIYSFVSMLQSGAVQSQRNKPKPVGIELLRPKKKNFVSNEREQSVVTSKSTSG